LFFIEEGEEFSKKGRIKCEIRKERRKSPVGHTSSYSAF
jgi:hypothetical protein